MALTSGEERVGLGGAWAQQDAEKQLNLDSNLQRPRLERVFLLFAMASQKVLVTNPRCRADQRPQYYKPHLGQKTWRIPMSCFGPQTTPSLSFGSPVGDRPLCSCASDKVLAGTAIRGKKSLPLFPGLSVPELLLPVGGQIWHPRSTVYRAIKWRQSYARC